MYHISSIKVFVSFASIDKKISYFLSPLTYRCLIHAVCALFALLHTGHGVHATAHLLLAILSPRQARQASPLVDTFPALQTLHFVPRAFGSDPREQEIFLVWTFVPVPVAAQT